MSLGPGVDFRWARSAIACHAVAASAIETAAPMSHADIPRMKARDGDASGHGAPVADSARPIQTTG